MQLFPLCAFVPLCFDEARQLMGEEGLCLAFYDQPDLVHDILDTIGATCERVLDEVTRLVPIDSLFIHEDLAGKSGPLVGPEQVAAFLKPYYRRSWDLVASRGARIFCQDSDGNMNPVMDAFIDCGVNLFYPMEPAAGMDMVAARRRYGPRIMYTGGIDKHVLRRGRDAIRRELEYKLQPSMRQGGVAFGLDHRITNGTSLENYWYYIRTAREILGLEREPTPSPWHRGGF